MARNALREGGEQTGNNATIGEGNNQATMETPGATQQLIEVLVGALQGRQSGGRSTIIERFRKMNPPPFKGIADSQAIQDWISRLEKIFDALECPEIEKVTCAAFIMEGEADRWWKLERERFTVNHELITWETFVDCLYERYFTQSIRDQKAVEFLELVQGNNTVGEYEAKFTELSRFASQVISSENLKARKFERGLRYELRKQVTILRLLTFTEVLDRAFIAEKEAEEGRKFREQWKRSASGGDQWKMTNGPSKNPPQILIKERERMNRLQSARDVTIFTLESLVIGKLKHASIVEK
ncbi:hypothetical protein BUALT_Bualt19G0053100 [Buddleja alternifolia]|uniref:Retrotransposon gag domain-containing protein n=1 Tax=Buddleja alternifolia TaxID=168488 RepID=A0AAV6W1P0_9LAMI|nr:hypothetical protein BUALT_Bualt19G0053100 [Buddleja alternifolia]